MKTSLRLLLTVFAAISIYCTQSYGRKTTHFAGVSFSNNKRSALHIVDETNLGRKTSRNPAVLWGVTFGRSLEIGKKLGLLFNWTADMGSVDEGEFLDEYRRMHNFLRMGFYPDFRFFLPHRRKLYPYVHAGGGVAYVRFNEDFFVADRNQKVDFADLEKFQARTWTMSVHGGAGADLAIKKDLKIGLSYWYEYSKPVKTTYSLDLPLSSVKYQETFLTHKIQLLLHFRLL